MGQKLWNEELELLQEFGFCYMWLRFWFGSIFYQRKLISYQFVLTGSQLKLTFIWFMKLYSGLVYLFIFF